MIPVFFSWCPWFLQGLRSSVLPCSQAQDELHSTLKDYEISRLNQVIMNVTTSNIINVFLPSPPPPPLLVTVEAFVKEVAGGVSLHGLERED
jgi:hypothetical protein